MRRVFVTGTDTEIGKTHAACALARELVRRGQKVAALKPVASGCEMTPDGLRGRSHREAREQQPHRPGGKNASPSSDLRDVNLHASPQRIPGQR